MVVPHGVLFRGAAEGRIRQKMIEKNLLDAVIGLPGNLFPTTNIPVAILVFDRSREKGGHRESCREVLFVDASREFVSGKNQNTLSEEQVEKIMRVYSEGKEVEKYAHVAEFAEIRENDIMTSQIPAVQLLVAMGYEYLSPSEALRERQERLLELAWKFTVFDGGLKKIARYQQYFVVKSTLNRVKHFDGRQYFCCLRT